MSVRCDVATFHKRCIGVKPPTATTQRMYLGEQSWCQRCLNCWHARAHTLSSEALRRFCFSGTERTGARTQSVCFFFSGQRPCELGGS